MGTHFWFKSAYLKIIKGEDEETNPMRYGKSVAEWISGVLNRNGFQSEVHPDDWGWRVDCTNDPCPIWIGCGNVDELDTNGEFVTPTNNSITWHCFIEADTPFFSKLFKKINPEQKIVELAKLLTSELENTDHITEVRSHDARIS